MAKYFLYWKDGKRESAEGENIAAAMTARGYGGGALAALDFYGRDEGEAYAYVWNVSTRQWDSPEAARPAPAGANEKEQCNERS